jgi:hypothetical protein
MNMPRFILAALAAFVAMMVFNFLWHGLLLESMYKATMSLWRPQDQMEEFFPWAAGITLAIGIALTLLFSRNYEEKGIGEGIRFGFYAGLLIGLLQAGIYPYLAIPLSLAGAWFIGGMLQGMVAGVTISLVYKR